MTMQQTYFRISQINEILRLTINENYLLKNIGIRGEIAEYSIRENYVYIDIFEKINENNVQRFKVILYKSNFDLKKFDSIVKNKKLKGKLISAYGNLNYYQGSVSLIVKDFILEDSDGEYKEKIERLRQEYIKKGYFDKDKKKEIPFILINVALITAENGAAIKDVLNNIHNKYCHIDLFNSKVQGEGAQEEIVSCIKKADKLGYDAILIVRGGGSAHDLRTFDSTLIVEAIYEAKTPIVTAIGHDKDRFLVDDVADLSKSTPSYVASEVIKNDIIIDNLFKDIRYKISEELEKNIYEYNKIFRKLENELDSLSVENVLLRKKGELKEISVLMDNILSERIFDFKSIFKEIFLKFDEFTPENKVNKYRSEFLIFSNKFNDDIFEKLSVTKQRLNEIKNEFEKNSPIHNMENGRFISIKDNKVIKSSEELNIGDEFELYSKTEILTVVVKSRRKNKGIKG